MTGPAWLPRAAAGPAGDTGLPQPIVLDEKSVTLTGTATASGTVTLLFDQVPSDRFWLVDRLVVSSTSSTPTKAYVYDDAPSNDHLLGGTNSGNFDYDDTLSPYLIDSGKQLQVVWTGASTGAVCTVRAQYRLMTRR